MSELTRRDRDQLAQVAKMRARIAKQSVEQRQLTLNAQVEDELSALFAAEEQVAMRAEAEAREIAARANADLLARLDELNVPARFRAQISVAKASELFRGSDSAQVRRMALRALAGARIKALGASAKVEVERQCAETVTQLIAGGLSGEDAQRFLDEMPTIDQLMLAPSVAELESALDAERRERRELMRGY